MRECPPTKRSIYGAPKSEVDADRPTKPGIMLLEAARSRVGCLFRDSAGEHPSRLAGPGPNDAFSALATGNASNGFAGSVERHVAGRQTRRNATFTAQPGADGATLPRPAQTVPDAPRSRPAHPVPTDATSPTDLMRQFVQRRTSACASRTSTASGSLTSCCQVMRTTRSPVDVSARSRRRSFSKAAASA